MIPADHRAVMASRQPTAADDPDFFPTPPWAARAGAELICRLDPFAAQGVWWEPACGAGHMAHGLADYARQLRTSDAYRYGPHQIFDFVAGEPTFEADWIVTNPPFALLGDFVRLAYARARRGVAMLMRAAVLESEGRYPLLYQDCPLTVFAPFSERVPMHKGRWEPDGSTAAFYAWFLFMKRGLGRRGARQAPLIIPIPPGTRERLTQADDARRFGVRPDPAKAEAAASAIRFAGQPLGKGRLETLKALARCGERGTCSVAGTALDGARLAALVQFELAERMAADRLGGNRYRVSTAGLDLLDFAGWVG